MPMRRDMQFQPGQLIRAASGTIYEVMRDGSYHRRHDLELQARGVGNPTVTKAKVKAYGG
jgi:hypothetical protein